MVVADLYFDGIRSLPTEADPPLVIDPDGVPAGAFPLKSLKPVTRRDSEIGKLSGSIKLDKLSVRNTCYSGIAWTRSILIQTARLDIFE
jgi:hypothetical protein